MAERIGWDKFEIALLIEACERNASGVPKQELVKELSAKLRSRAISQGQKIDDLFRNENGIALQMIKMDYLLTNGTRGLPGASKFFAEMVVFKETHPTDFELILKTAKQQTGEERNVKVKMINKRSDFICWIKEQGKMKVHPNSIISVLDESSEYAKKHGVTKISFWEMEDTATFISAYRKLSANKLFRVFKRDTAQMLDKVFDYYRTFLNTFNATEKYESEPDQVQITQNTKKSNNPNSSVQDMNPELYDKVYSALKKLSDEKKRGISVLSIYELVGGKLPEIKSILDQATWASVDGKLYRFVETIEDYTVPSTDNYVETIMESSAKVTSNTENTGSDVSISTYDTDFAEWLRKKGLSESSVRGYVSALPSAEAFAKSHSIPDICLISTNIKQVLSSIDALLANKAFIEHNQTQHGRYSAAFRKLRDYFAEIDRRETQMTSDTELEIKNPTLYHKLYSVSKVFDDPQGLSVDHILTMIGSVCSKEELVEFLDRISLATKLSENVYTFAKITKPIIHVAEKPKQTESEPTDYDKDAFIRVLMCRYQSGMQFDSIDLENFRDTYENMYDEKLSFSDEELEVRLKHCGILYKDRLFPAEGIIDNGTKERLFAYIENTFAAGNKVLYYKAIFSDLADAFAYCFSLTDEEMLKAYIEHTAEKDKYYFHGNFMSTEKNVTIDHSAEIENFMLAAGKPLSYDEVYDGLSHISQNIIHRAIRSGHKFIMNGKEQYFHIDIFEFSEEDRQNITAILDNEISENGYAIWSTIFDTVKEQMPTFLENNLYLAPLGIRNSLSNYISDRFSFNGDVISFSQDFFGMADVYRLFAKNNVPFSDTDIYEFSKKTDPVIYFWAVAEEAIRVSKDLFVAKDQIEFDVVETDKAIATYLSSGYILIKDVDSFLVFPNVGYEWNEYLLESYLLNYSERFSLVNNGTSLNNVAGAIAYKDGEYTNFVDVCAEELANSGIELKKTVALNYLAEINLITRRSYKDIESAMTKAKQIRNLKG